MLSLLERRHSCLVRGIRGKKRKTDSDGERERLSDVSASPRRTSKVLSPPRLVRKARREKAPNGTVEGLREGMVPAESFIVSASAAKSRSMPETPDDCEVIPIQRVPFWNNPYYNRLADNEHNVRNRREADGMVLSPVTPANTRLTRPTKEQVSSDDVPVGSDIIKDGLNDVCKRSLHPDMETDANNRRILLQSFREMFRSFYRDVESFFKTEMAQVQIQLSDRFGDVEKGLGRSAKEIEELRVVLAGRGGGSTVSRSTPLPLYESKLEAQTMHAVWVFDTDTIAKVLNISLPHIVIKTCQERGNFMEKVSLAFRAVLFGLLPSQKRSAFSTGVGKRHSAFPYSIVMNIIYNVQNNRFNRFLAEGEKVNRHVEERTPSRSDPDNATNNLDANAKFSASETRIPRPEWLEPGYIRECDVKEARARVELAGGSRETAIEDGNNTSNHKQKKRWMNAKETPSRGDIARFGALKVYRLVTTGLYVAREKAKLSLFEELTYIMTIWDDLDGAIDQKGLRMRWGCSDEDFEEVRMDAVTDTKTRSTDPINADEDNQSLFAEFLSERKEMVLYVSHEVHVRPDGSSIRQKRGVETRTLQRSLNLIDIASKFCVAFSQQAMGTFSVLPFLGAHSGSLKCIFAFAMLLRSIMDSFMEENMVDCSFLAPEDDGPRELEYHGVKLDTILPSVSTQRRILSGRCLRLTTDEFEKLSLGSFEVHDSANSQVVNSEIGDDIGPDTAGGLMLV